MSGDSTVHSEPQPHRRKTKRGVALLCPDRMVRNVTEVEPQELKRMGIEGVILDLDNTLVLWHREEIDDAVAAWLEKLKASGLKLCILSNSILSNRSERIAQRLNAPNVRQARKPSRSGFRRAMAAMGTHAHNTAMIGDQMFTDILGGNRIGVHTIMVKPIHTHEFAYTRYVSRPPERLLLQYFRKRGKL